MSGENVETMRRCFELVAAGDADSLAALATEDVELRSAIAGGATGVIYRGTEGARQYVTDLAEAWKRFDQVVEEFIDLGENGVLAIFRVEARGRTSGVEMAQRLAAHWTFKDGKPWRGVGYSDVDEALEAVGLRE